MHPTDLLAVTGSFAGSVDVIRPEQIDSYSGAARLWKLQYVRRRKLKSSRGSLTHLDVVTFSSFRQACQGCTCMPTRIRWLTQDSKLLIVEYVAILSRYIRDVAGV